MAVELMELAGRLARRKRADCPPRQRTLRRTLVWLPLTALLPAAIGAGLALWLQWNGQREAVQEGLLGTARAMVLAVDRELESGRARLEVLASSPLLDPRDWSAFQGHACDVAAPGSGRLITLSDASGQMLLNTLMPVGARLPNLWQLDDEDRLAHWEGQDLPLSTQGIARQVFSTGNTAYSDLYYGLHVRRPTVALSVPVWREGRVAYALSLSFSPDDLERFLGTASAGRGLRLTLVDRHRRVIATKGQQPWHVGDEVQALPAPRAGAPASGTFQYVARDGVEIVGAYVVSPTSGWTVRVALPKAQAFAGAYRAGYTWLGVFAAALAAGLFFANCLARRLTAPLHRLADSAEALQHGQTPAVPDSHIRELDTLGRALTRAMQWQREHQEERLRRVVAEERELAAARAAQALRESEVRLRRVLDNLYAHVAVLDLDGTLLEINRAPVERAGLAREDVIGQPFWRCPWWTHEPAVQQRLREAIAMARHGSNVRYDVRVRMAGALMVTTDFQLAPLRDEAGRVTALIASAVDITERVAAEAALRESAARFRALADNMSQLAWIADAAGKPFWYNRRWYDYTGTTLDRMQRDCATALIHPDHTERVTTKFKHHVKQGRVWEDTYPLRGRDGGFRWFLSRALPIRDREGRVKRWFGTHTDITEQRAAEQALRDSEERLLKSERALREADRQKDVFLATLAHELRNPLAPIRAAVHVIRLRRPDDAAVARAGEVIDRQSAHMARLVDDLLEVSRITLGRIELQRRPDTLAAIVGSAVESARPAIDARGQRLSVELPAETLPLHADGTRLSQALQNVLNNAVKFTPPGGAVELRAAREGAEVCVTVRDEGAGIAPDMLEHVFDLFVQERRAGGHEGLGIGLALARRLIEMHDGSIRADSAGPGRGTCVTIRLPLAAPAAEPAPPAPPEPAEEAPLRVLLVDDNIDAAESLQTLLSLQGHEVRVAHDGRGALAACAAWQPPVVVLDIGLPDLDGYEVAHRLRQLQPQGGPVLVALTGWGQAADRERAREAGFDHHFTKPVDPAALTGLLSGLRSRRPGREETAPLP